jgi:surface antigen
MLQSSSQPGIDDAPTGSITKAAAPASPSPLSKNLDDEDWRRAQGAMSIALDPQGNGETVTWDNPQTKAKGAFTPVAFAYPANDSICRAFLARIEAVSQSETLQGTACRAKNGDWAITESRPWRKA